MESNIWMLFLLVGAVILSMSQKHEQKPSHIPGPFPPTLEPGSFAMDENSQQTAPQKASGAQANKSAILPSSTRNVQTQAAKQKKPCEKFSQQIPASAAQLQQRATSDKGRPTKRPVERTSRPSGLIGSYA